MKMLAFLVTMSAFWFFTGCTNEDDGLNITGPDFPPGSGSIYPIKDVTFPTVDNIEVRAHYGQQSGPGPHPIVILVHDVGGSSQVFGGLEWLTAGFFEELLKDGYSPLAIDLRGHGDTPYPDDGRDQEVLLITDLANFYLDVRAALNWLRDEPSVDASRIAIVGNGAGGNVAYVSMGAFPDDLQAGVALSPGIFDFSTRQPLIVGENLEDFSPHSMMYLVAEQDVLSVSENVVLSYAGWAAVMNERTGEPKDLTVFKDKTAHGLALLEDSDAVDALLGWLEKHL